MPVYQVGALVVWMGHQMRVKRVEYDQRRQAYRYYLDYVDRPRIIPAMVMCPLESHLMEAQG